MTVAEEIVQRLAELPSDRQAEVLDFVEFLTSRGGDVDLGPDWDRELDRRVREIEDGRSKGLAAELVIREMRAKYG